MCESRQAKASPEKNVLINEVHEYTTEILRTDQRFMGRKHACGCWQRKEVSERVRFVCLVRIASAWELKIFLEAFETTVDVFLGDQDSSVEPQGFEKENGFTASENCADRIEHSIWSLLSTAAFL